MKVLSVSLIPGPSPEGRREIIESLAATFTLKTSVDRSFVLESLMHAEFYDVFNAHRKGESATYPQAALSRRLALLRIGAGGSHAASSRLARHHASTPCGHVQLRFLG